MYTFSSTTRSSFLVGSHEDILWEPLEASLDPPVWECGPVNSKDNVLGRNYFVIPPHSYAPHSCHALISQALQQVSICLIHQVYFRDDTLSTVQAPVGCHPDFKIGYVSLFKEDLCMLLVVYFNQDFSSSLFFGLIFVTNDALQKFRY